MKFKVGDKVRRTHSCNNVHGMLKGQIYIVSSRTADLSNYIYVEEIDMQSWDEDFFELVKGGTMSKHAELADRISNVVGWTKEADDIIQEINQGKEALTIEIKENFDKTNNCFIKVWWIKVSLEQGSGLSPDFEYKSQYQKNDAFKEALMWLLDHSDIKKDLVGQEVKADIEGKVYKVKVMEEL